MRSTLDRFVMGFRFQVYIPPDLGISIIPYFNEEAKVIYTKPKARQGPSRKKRNGGKGNKGRQQRGKRPKGQGKRKKTKGTTSGVGPL